MGVKAEWLKANITGGGSPRTGSEELNKRQNDRFQIQFKPDVNSILYCPDPAFLIIKLLSGKLPAAILLTSIFQLL